MKNTENFQLETRLKKHRDFWGSKLTAAQNETMERHIEFLRDSGALDKVLKKGDHAPEFNLKNQNGEIISSYELLKKGPLVVSFYRGSWCPYCVEEVKALDLFYPEIQANGADLVVLSPQSFSRTEKQAEELHLKYNLLVDDDNKTGKAFGLVYEFPQYLKDLYMERFNNNIQKINEGSAWELPIPARFVIGQDGKILDVLADPDYRFRPEPYATLTFIKNLEKP
ncbi:peroxiredoxin-like family protein [Epilithonimonas arachidiradicis]|uniref:thioredoxin-dependent peroxiredoxin n=1 Tax=Epilithonimonas arachidiradicis TaxID=1617282 RepID=A0A420D8X5_9FLAO|nr:peroxiredoxin-like family protein [Epilithonimonas arachidiradicis]RKE87231.1 peroxiredoxin [Epilithonimonas arachidiradicis]GGG59319.1 peroxiredoxin [Epilithonimonas arachidiradicis]